MKELKIDYTTLKKRLNEVKCPYRLYWARIRALEIATGQNLEVKIREDIIDKIESLKNVPLPSKRPINS